MNSTVNDEFSDFTRESKRLGVSRHRLLTLVREAGVPVYRLSARRTRVRRTDINDWLESRRM